MKESEREALREKIGRAEKVLFEEKKKLAELRKSLPKEEVGDYRLKDFDGKEVRLSSLFGERDELMVIHNMGKSCPYCTLWADGFNGVVGHLDNRVPFVVVSPDDPATQSKFAESRGWAFDMLSAADSDFTRDMGFEIDGDPWPGVSTFERSADGKIYRIAWSFFGPGDDFCSVWHLFELLPKGKDGWEPKYKY